MAFNLFKKNEVLREPAKPKLDTSSNNSTTQQNNFQPQTTIMPPPLAPIPSSKFDKFSVNQTAPSQISTNPTTIQTTTNETFEVPDFSEEDFNIDESINNMLQDKNKDTLTNNVEVISKPVVITMPVQTPAQIAPQMSSDFGSARIPKQQMPIVEDKKVEEVKLSYVSSDFSSEPKKIYEDIEKPVLMDVSSDVSSLAPSKPIDFTKEIPENSSTIQNISIQPKIDVVKPVLDFTAPIVNNISGSSSLESDESEEDLDTTKALKNEVNIINNLISKKEATGEDWSFEPDEGDVEDNNLEDIVETVNSNLESNLADDEDNKEMPVFQAKSKIQNIEKIKVKQTKIKDDDELGKFEIHTELISQALFVRKDEYKQIIGYSDLIKEEIRKTDNLKAEITGFSESQENNFQELGKQLRSIRDNILMMDRKIFEEGD